ncbi:histone chaperone [Savitreella phatthalungensis]
MSSNDSSSNVTAPAIGGMNITNKRLSDLAPTPMNTPASVSQMPGGAKAAPGVARIDEDKEERDNIAGALAGNPQLLNMIQGKLGTLVGKSSGYVEGLPADVRRRVNGLKGVQSEHAKLEAKFQEEILALEKKYLGLYQPLYDRRAQIVIGAIEPSEDEIQVGMQDDEDDEESQAETDSASEKIEGIPEFWLTAMRNVVSLSEMITSRDESALKSLQDIRISYLDKPGFRLSFHFANNDFFTNKEVTKTYFYQEEAGYGGDFIYDRAEGDTIHWKDGQDLTVRYETKKQRNKNTKQTRIVKKTVPVESFFNFFNPPSLPEAAGENDDDVDVASDIDERLELDYQIGEDIKEKLIPRAVDWFTGAALAYEELDNEDMDEDDFEDYDEDLSEDSDDEEEGEATGKDGSTSAAAKQDPECRQQ